MAATRKPTSPTEEKALEYWRNGYPVLSMRTLAASGYNWAQREAFLRTIVGLDETVVDYASDRFINGDAETDNNRFLYIYATGRDDGFRYAVGEYIDDMGHANGSLALFQRAQDAHTFAYAIQASEGAMVHVLPSAELETD